MDPLEHLSSLRRFGFEDFAVNVLRLAVEMSSVGKLATRSLNDSVLIPVEAQLR